jgi:site-specific recombinase XerD
MGEVSMTPQPSFAPLLERFFTQRLITQKQVSPHTIASYRDTFRLFLQFARKQTNKAPSDLAFSDIGVELVEAFLTDLEKRRGISARSRNLRLSALRSFFRYALYYEPMHAGRIQQILVIPAKRHDRTLVGFLTRPEVEALLAAPDIRTWNGRRDHALLLVAFQTGMRLSEITGLRRHDVELDSGAHARCLGKGRKERCTPLAVKTVKELKAWIKEPAPRQSEFLFPTVHGQRMSADAVQSLFSKYTTIARRTCFTLRNKHLSPHVARHTAAMELLQAGVDLSVIALWLGHESIETTQKYLDAHIALKEAALAKTAPLSARVPRFRPGDRLLQFLNGL